MFVFVFLNNNNKIAPQIPGDDIHSVRFPRNKEEANELKKELELLPKDEDIAELMKFGAKDVEHAKDILFKAGGEMQRAKDTGSDLEENIDCTCEDTRGGTQDRNALVISN